MNIIYSIKVCKDTIRELSSLECVESISEQGGKLFVWLRNELTRGKQLAMNGDYICKFASGLWQRYGSVAFDKAYRDPRKEAGSQW